MTDYQIYDPTPEDEKRRRADWLYWFDQLLGPLNLIDIGIGELQMATDSRGKRRRRRQGPGRLRIVLHREAPETPKDVTDLLNRYGVRVRKHLHDGDNFYFHVRASQAQWAVTVLDRWKAGTLGGTWKEKAQARKAERKVTAPGWFEKFLGG